MFTTDNLFFLILFFVPGTIYLLFNRYLRLTPQIENDNGVRLAGAFVFSVVIFFISTFMYGENMQLFMSQKNIYDDISLLLKIIGFNVIISFIVSILWTSFGKKIITFISNPLYKRLNRSNVVENELIWNELFETNNLIDNRGDRVVCIEKDGQVTYGLLKMQSAQITGKTEFLIVYSSEIEAYFKRDEISNEKDKVFPKKSYVYINIENGLRITFYDTMQYRKWLKEHR